MRLPLALLLLAATAPAFAADIDASLDTKIQAWRRDLHQHPELGNRETRTAGIVAAHLKALGLEPKSGIAHTGVTAVLRGGKPGPRIALRADMDALPVTERSDLPFASKATARRSAVRPWA
jgi:metal-dependent amidase/aminoacylase/carboxypeptidase family protein